MFEGSQALRQHASNEHVSLPFGTLAYAVLVSGVTLAATLDDYDPKLDLHDPKWLDRLDTVASAVIAIGVFVFAFRGALRSLLLVWSVLAVPSVLLSVVQNVRVVAQLARLHEPDEPWPAFLVGTFIGAGVYAPAWYLNIAIAFAAW